MTSSGSSFRLPFDDAESSVDARIDARDRASRERAVDPRFNIALEASAGTGKTRVLVDRYINLLREGVDPSNILAITFTRKAAAEMRERIVSTLRAAAVRGEFTAARWRELRDRVGDIAINTIDAFCLSLLREFPLEADLDPGFSLADETEVPRLVDEALDRTLSICRGLAREDEDVALAFAQLSERRVRAGLAALLNRRIVARDALKRFLASGPRDLDVATACRRASMALQQALEAMPGGTERFLETGPLDPSFTLLARDLHRLFAGSETIADPPRGGTAVPDPALVQSAFSRVREHFLTQEGTARKRLDYAKSEFVSVADWKHQKDVVIGYAESIAQVLAAYRRDLNVIVSRGIWRMFQIAMAEYRRTLDAHAVLDFADVLLHALELLRKMDEFAQSRYRLEARYHHILVDEFQDTSRAQWELVSLLVQSWGHGLGLPHTGPLAPSIFLVGDRKQSIYGFRDADVSVLDEASRYLGSLRPDGDVRRAISRSFRAVPALLAFVNDVCTDIDKVPVRADRFRFEEQDRFPVDKPQSGSSDPANDAESRPPVLGIVTADTPEECAVLTAAEIARLLATADVRDRDSGVPRRARAGDVAILFRTRESHREFEEALERHGIPSYVYKGLGFFDADEIKDSLAVLAYLADPLSDLRAAAFMRSRFLRITDEGLRRLAPRLADALRSAALPPAAASLDDDDRRALEQARASTTRWRGLVDRLPPAELFDLVLAESAYGVELRGPRLPQARENLKKMRALVRRIQNRGYATLGRIAAHLDRLSAGDESNAVIDALDAVNLMTVHAAKGLEFPIVFVVNLARGTGNRRDPVRVNVARSDDRDGDDGGEAREQAVSVSVGDFQSEADEDGAAREREETKRLLYVALTRARDRLYLGSVLKEGQLQPGRGSLAEVLPPTLCEMFAQATTATDKAVTWRASSGTSHRFGVVNPGVPDALSSVSRETASRLGAEDGQRIGEPGSRLDDFEPLADTSTRRAHVTAPGTGSSIRDSVRGGDSDRLVGTLVHRLIERQGLAGTVTKEDVERSLGSLLDADELADVVDLRALATRAAAGYTAVCSREDVQALCGAGDMLHEVPFTMATEEGIVRGTIDCLVRRPDGAMTILEFKTGRARSEHRVQLDLYARAAAQLFPGVSVDAALVYTDSRVKAPTVAAQ
jgi:ATP-dependent helicase/nuclease subunit A